MENILCPRCGRDGESVAAIHYRENVKTEGRFSGGGVGPTFSGDGGLGLVAIGASGRHESISQSRRAAVFWEPIAPEHQMTDKEAKQYGIAGLVVFGSAMAGLLIFPPGGRVEDVNSMLVLVLSFFVFISAFMALVSHFSNEPDPNIKMLDDYQKAREMFHKMQYCDNCFLLYDDLGNSQPADKDGYHKMINLNSPLPVADGTNSVAVS